MTDIERAEFEAMKADVAELKKELENCKKRVAAAQKLAEHMATRAEAFWDLLQAWKGNGE